MIDALWRSLDPAGQSDVDRAWLEESHDRLKAFKAGKFTALDGEETLRAIESEIKP